MAGPWSIADRIALSVKLGIIGLGCVTFCFVVRKDWHTN
jgi:hypothetical protein